MTTSGNRPRYPGSRPFAAEDREVFFGRDEPVRQLVTTLRLEQLTVLYGRSGLGKSSLVNAGVAPRLSEDHDYLVVPVRFTSWMEGVSPLPLVSFERRLREFSSNDNFLSAVEGEEPSAWQYFKSIQLENRDKSAILLVFDQFEELFTYPQGVEDFAEALADVVYDRMPASFRRAMRLQTRLEPDLVSDENWASLAKGPAAKVLLAIRSDKMSAVNSLSESLPNILRSCYELETMSVEEAEKAITLPAQKPGEFLSPAFTYEEEALELMLDYLSKDRATGIEPFQLQILCQHVEEAIVVKTDDTYIEVHDLGKLGQVYESYYERSIGKLAPHEQGLARVLIEEGLVFEQEERRLSLYEGQITTAWQVSPELLRALVDTHIIRAEPYSGGGYAYEVSHDTLVQPILRAKARRKEAELLEEMDQEQQEKKALRDRKRRRLGIGCGSWILLWTAGTIWSWIGAAGDESFFLAVFLIPYILFVLVVLLAPFYLLHEFVTEESLMARWRRRRAERKARAL